MRTAEQEVARYTWLPVRVVAEELGKSAEHVRKLMRAGEFEAMDVSLKPGVTRPDYVIDPKSFEAFKERRRVA